MQAIEVKYLPVTNHKPARLKVFSHGKAKVYSMYTKQCECAELNISTSFENCAKLCVKEFLPLIGWESYSGTWQQGTLKNQHEVFVYVPDVK